MSQTEILDVWSQQLQSGELTMQTGSGAAQEAGNIVQDGVRIALILHSIAALSKYSSEGVHLQRCKPS